MMRILSLLLMAVIFLAMPARSQAPAGAGDKVVQDLAAAEAKLNSVYKKALADSTDDPQFCINLRAAQSAWLQYVDYHMKTAFPAKPGEIPGAKYAQEYAEAKLAMVKQRTRQIQMLQDFSVE